MKKKLLKNFILPSCLLGISIVGGMQLTSCSCSNKKNKPSIRLEGNNFQKANSEGIANFNFTSNFNPTNGIFNFKLLNYDESIISLTQTSSIAIKQESQYKFSVVLKINTDNNLPIKFNLEISGEINGSNFTQIFEQLEAIKDIDPSIPEKEPRSTTREATFDENKIAEFQFQFITQADDKKVTFELFDNDELSLVDNIIEIDDASLIGILKVKLNNNQNNNESEYLFNLKVSFKVDGFNYEYTYQGFKCLYKIDKINFISNNIYTSISSIDEQINYRFSFLHIPTDGRCDVSVTSTNNIVGFANNQETTSTIDIDSENRLCEFSLKLLDTIDFQDKYCVEIPFNLKFTFQSSIFGKQVDIDYPQQFIIRLINPDAFLEYNGNYIKNINNYEQAEIQYTDFILNSGLTFDNSYQQPVEIKTYEVIDGKDEYIESLSYDISSNNKCNLILSLNTNLLQQDAKESLVFKINTTIHALDNNDQPITSDVSFEGFEIKFDVIKSIPENLLEINGQTINGINTTEDLSEYNTLTIPKNIIWIGQNAFNNKLPSNITKLIFEQDSQLQEIKDCAFEDCSLLNCELKLPETLYNIGQNAFKNCSGLIGELKIPDQVVNLNIGAFEECINLTSLKLGTTQIINNNCFKNCINLSGDLIIPYHVTQINESAFENCISLSRLIFEKNDMESTNITQISNKAFYNCKNISLTNQFPTSIGWIGKNCFQGCVNLAHELTNNAIIIHQQCSIDECSFSGCNSIKEVSLMANTTIGNSAFANCANLEKLFISKDVNKYNWTEAFFNCSKLNEIDLSEFETVPGSWEFGSSSETFSNCASNGTIIVKNQEIGTQLLQFMQSKGINGEWTFTIKTNRF